MNPLLVACPACNAKPKSDCASECVCEARKVVANEVQRSATRARRTSPIENSYSSGMWGYGNGPDSDEYDKNVDIAMRQKVLSAYEKHIGHHVDGVWIGHKSGKGYFVGDPEMIKRTGNPVTWLYRP